ncbi:hypothetical protein ACN9KI_03455 [Aliarcobacter butzleri]|uniref:hypothetical protein n=1 Tax=Aliarcobacter butzleri TaxID=28197 RepID=UPI003B21EEB7
MGFLNWITKKTGRYVEKIYFEKVVMNLESDNRKLRNQLERCDQLLLTIIDSFHNFNYCDKNDFSEKIRIIAVNIRLLTRYTNTVSNFHKLNKIEFKRLEYLIGRVLHKALSEFEINEDEFHEFELFFKGIGEAYGWNFIITYEWNLKLGREFGIARRLDMPCIIGLGVNPILIGVDRIGELASFKLEKKEERLTNKGTFDAIARNLLMTIGIYEDRDFIIYSDDCYNNIRQIAYSIEEILKNYFNENDLTHYEKAFLSKMEEINSTKYKIKESKKFIINEPIDKTYNIDLMDDFFIQTKKLKGDATNQEIIMLLQDNKPLIDFISSLAKTTELFQKNQKEYKQLKAAMYDKKNKEEKIISVYEQILEKIAYVPFSECRKIAIIMLMPLLSDSLDLKDQI